MYWTQTFPNITEKTRSGVVTYFTSMADNMSDRGVHGLIANETNVTPEMMLSGKIVILDINLKENKEGGLMVQAAWKLLFQQAIERRADKQLDSARPVFLWEDEAHLFFSKNDCDFQPTARDCRACHVLISQNLQNYYRNGQDEHAVMSVFSAMNTHIFHANGDHETNRWASQKIGMRTRLKVSASGILRPITEKDVSLFPRYPEHYNNRGGVSLAEEKEPAIPPEQFSRLKKGGDGTCDAVILWLSHQFEVNGGKNYCVKTFTQD
jgi:type IV secretory pathway TraG/TraD family ATPase VirD4